MKRFLKIAVLGSVSFIVIFTICPIMCIKYIQMEEPEKTRTVRATETPQPHPELKRLRAACQLLIDSHEALS